MRKIININAGWKFIRSDVGLPAVYPAEWSDVNLPHTWNAVDGNDGMGNYYRGKCWYAKSFATPVQPLAGGKVFVEVLAANSEATVYVNGTEVTYHEGGYAAFRADITKLCKAEGENLLVIACNNEANDFVYPQNADFTFYGGLYRGVNLISVPNAHFDLEYYGGPGIMVTPKPADCGGAAFELEAFVKNADENFTVQYTILDEEGLEVAYVSRPASAPKVTVFLPDAHLWDFENPYLYTVTAELVRRNEVYDEIETRAGVRSFSVDPQKGFFLNGVLTPLRGVARHQDRMYIGNALEAEDHYEDAYIIKELGANTVRLAHYQHNQYFYDACDELGFAVWAEIPFISVMSKNPAAHENCRQQMKELIAQNYNHPSVMFWGLSNEILIGGISEQVVDNHKELNALVKEMDPTRPTVIAHVSFTPVEGPMHYITDLESYNHYFGWYGGKMEQNGPWMDDFHRVHPNISIGVSEYGCEGIITYHGPNPKVRDYSEDYQALYHEHMCKVFEERPWIWATHVWNMFDFGCAARNEGGVAGRNNKGLVSMDRKIKKDAYYICKSYWNPEPMVHLCGKRYAQRSGDVREIKVYTNQPSVTLYHNGKVFAQMENIDHICRFDVPLSEGFNQFTAVAGTVKDTMTIEKVTSEPEVYTLAAGGGGAVNWFIAMGDVELDDAPMEFPKGKLSVKSSLEQLHKNPEAWAIVDKLMGGKLNPDMPMWNMICNINFEMLIAMNGGDEEGKAVLKSVNKQLIEFDEVE